MSGEGAERFRDDCLRHVVVAQDARAGSGQETSVSTEVSAVVDLVLDHARRLPEASLGVIALGIRHAERIDEMLRLALADHPGLEAFFAEDRPEPFFVKNLERVQGDERDSIILSIGYGKHRDGRMRYHWGPLLRNGGERRLNVAVTRARHRLTLVSSFSSRDVDPDRVTSAPREWAKRAGIRLSFVRSAANVVDVASVSGLCRPVVRAIAEDAGFWLMPFPFREPIPVA